MVARTTVPTTHGVPLRQRGVVAAQIAVLLGMLSACAGLLGFVTYYDATTYENLTAGKAETLALYESFTSIELDEVKIAAVELQLSKAYEYERGKGGENEPTWSQIDTIRGMVKRAVLDRRNRGAWSQVNKDNKVELINTAFDIAIATEASKNKNE